MINNMPKIIVITGAESTGKSVLTETLAKYYNVPYIPEIARDYVEKLDRKYNYQDIETIAWKQIEQLNQHLDFKNPFVFTDTWLIITKIWFEFVFNKVPDWLETEIRNTKIDLFLVCDIDLPWIPDPVRENGGDNRKILHNKYIEEIEKYNFKYQIVSGQNKNRLNNAINCLKFL